MGRMLGLLAGVLAGWLAFRFLRRRRAASMRAAGEPEGDPVSELRDKLSTARQEADSASRSDEPAGAAHGPAAGAVKEPVAPSEGESGDAVTASGVASLEGERQRVHDRAREAVERMRPNDQSD
ncbi:MAG: hypothetical protein OXG37_06870 [Actinomycetia bacterium]|nr:hypothetical protein [Actinomycetes bacterium]